MAFLANCLLPTGHRFAAGWFLAIGLAHLALGGGTGLALRLALAAPAGEAVTLDQYDRLFPPHGVLAVHFAVVPAALAVGGLALVPPAVGAKRVALPWLLPPACYLHLLTVPLAGGGVFDPRWLVCGVAVVYLALALVTVNLLATVLFCRGAGAARELVPVFAWMVCLGAMSVNSAYLLSLESLWSIATAPAGVGAGPPLPGSLAWDAWPDLGGLLGLLAAVPTAALLVEAMLSGRPEAKYTTAASVTRWLAAVVLTAIWLGNTAAAITLTLSAGKLPEPVGVWTEIAGPLFGTFLTAVVYGVAVVVGATRGTFRDAPVALLAVAGMVLGLAGSMSAPLLGRIGTDLHLRDTHVVPAGLHATAAVILLALLAAFLTRWPALTGREYSRTFTAVGCVLLVLGIAGDVVAQAVVGWFGVPRRYPYPPAEFQPLHAAACVATPVALVGAAWIAVTLALSLLVGRRVVNVPVD